jgi:hypothetical protein
MREDLPNIDRIALQDIDYDYELTDYAFRFMQACQGPSAAAQTPPKDSNVSAISNGQTTQTFLLGVRPVDLEK